jgi:Peptidase family M13
VASLPFRRCRRPVPFEAPCRREFQLPQQNHARNCGAAGALEAGGRNGQPHDGQAIGRAYVARYFSPEAKAQIDDLVGHLRIALKERIGRLDWMSPQTKLNALDKLARLHVKLAYFPGRRRTNRRLCG